MEPKGNIKYLKPFRNAEDANAAREKGKEKKSQIKLDKMMPNKNILNLLMNLSLEEFASHFNEIDKSDILEKFSKTDEVTVEIAVGMQAIKQAILYPQNSKLLETIWNHTNGKPYERLPEAPTIDIPIAQDPMDIAAQLPTHALQMLLESRINKELVEKKDQEIQLQEI